MVVVAFYENKTASARAGHEATGRGDAVVRRLFTCLGAFALLKKIVFDLSPMPPQALCRSRRTWAVRFAGRTDVSRCVATNFTRRDALDVVQPFRQSRPPGGLRFSSERR